MLADVASRIPDRRCRCVRLGRSREVDGGLGEIELCLWQSDELERVCGRNRDHQCARVRVSDVLGREDDHAARDEAGILSSLEHRREVVDGGVGIPAAHRLDERRGEVVVLVSLPVVEQRALAGCVEDMALCDRLALRTRGVARELEDLERASCVPSCPVGDEDDQIVRDFGLQSRRSAPHDNGELFGAE